MAENIETGAEAPEEPGHDVCAELGGLPDGAVVSEGGLARLFGKHPASIKRAVERGELPPPVRLMGRPVWTAGVLRRHLDRRLEEAAEARRREVAKIRHLER